ncbi:MAG: Maf family protein [Candidatus Sungbacteria bacterium]|nr:Maf family protein [bacterium]MDZ4260209.1 Maf family protein [Candidatus Sungbacteria bacterium]
MIIILGSQSKGRKEVLETMGIPFTLMSADVDEKAIRHDDPATLTKAIAHAKATALLPQIREEALLITADTVVVSNHKIREKSANYQEAAENLRVYSAYPLQIVSAVVVTNTKTGEQRDGIDIATVWFGAIPEDVIAQMALRPDICSFAGAFAFQDPLQRKYIERFEGEEESILGLPKMLTLRLLREIGYVDVVN